jgi:ABC-type nitrate/sulfonate/bicarbonate transport system permease component
MKRLLGLAGICVVFEMAARISQSPILVPVSQIARAFTRMLISGELIEHAAVSLLRVGLGFLVAAFLGVGLGLLVYQHKTIEAVVMPVVDAIRPIAALTIFPVIILLMGLGLASKAFVIFWTAYPACLLNTVQGLRSVSREPLEAARLDGASSYQVLFMVTIPLALPTIITGLRIGLSGGWISLVAAEMLGAQSGLGWAVLAYSSAFQFPQMYAAILAIALLGFVMNISLTALQRISDLEDTHHEETKLISFGDRSAAWFTGSLFKRWG